MKHSGRLMSGGYHDWLLDCICYVTVTKFDRATMRLAREGQHGQHHRGERQRQHK